MKINLIGGLVSYDKMVEEAVLSVINAFWPVTTKDVADKLEGMTLEENDVLEYFKALGKEEKIVFRESDEGVFAWPIEVDRFIKE
jgi:hypothetical protein